jgi:hypothetical protein
MSRTVLVAAFFMVHLMSERVSKVYIAGPISGRPDFNRQSFNMAELQLISAGNVVLNPARLPHGLAENEYMAIALSMVQISDELYMLDGWQDSSGAKAEHALAHKLGKHIIYQKAELGKENQLWNWFSLSRAVWLTLPRVLLHEMPIDWQNSMAKLLSQYDQTFSNTPNITTQVNLVNESGRMLKMPAWLTDYRHPDRSEINNLKQPS